MGILIQNIRFLYQVWDHPPLKVSGVEMKTLPFLQDAFVWIKDGIIQDFGPMERVSDKMKFAGPETVQLDAAGGSVFPSWCDAHTHIVFAGSREGEFADRISGMSYQEIAARGGGILNSAKKLKDSTLESLYESAFARLQEMATMGTGAVEIKSGYGLDSESEIKMLKVIQRLKNHSDLTIKSTFLGAHAVPPEFKGNKAGYLRLLKEEMLPTIAKEKLADFCDIFCEDGYFDAQDTIELLECASSLGIQGKVHAEQLSHSGGTKAGVNSGARSVDHLEFVDDDDIRSLKNSSTIPVILPGAQWFLQLPFPPARKMIDSGLPLALATDFNPGSSPSGNMNLMISLACVQYKMSPAEAIHAATLNGAYAMDVSEKLGTVTRGKMANLFITKPEFGEATIPYYFGHNPIARTILNGKVR